MTGTSDARLIDLWEIAAKEHHVDRALTLIAAHDPGVDRQTLAELPIDQRDARLFGLALSVVGPSLSVTATCDACGGKTDLDIAIADILAQVPSDRARSRVFTHGGQDHEFRLPNSLDLAQALKTDDPTVARQTLLSALIDAPDASPVLLDAFEAHLAEKAGIEALTLGHACSECGEQQAAPVDIVDILWQQISARAQHLLWDIHLLAKSYGWSSSEILSLSPTRRAAHVAMVSG
jgi:hypothetical protein